MKKFLFLFLLLPTLAFGLTVDDPQSGELIPAGSTYLIQWTATDATSFNLYLSYDNGVTWGKAMNGSVKVVGNSFNWPVPLQTKNRTKCKIKVFGYNDAGTKIESITSPLFTINVLNVLYPNGPADNLEAGHIKTIIWETVTLADVTSAKLSYTINNGLTWLTIATITGNPGSYDWTVPQIAKSAKIKVDLIKEGKVAATDASNAAFRIVITPKSTAGAVGTYYGTNLEYDYFTTPGKYYTEVHAATLNGGTLDFTTPYWSDAVKLPPAGTDIPFTVAADGQISVFDKRGIISDDGNIVLLADYNRLKARDLDFGLSIKATAGLSEATLNGAYIMGQAGNSPDGGWAALYTVTMDNGNGNVHCESMTNGCFTDDLPFTYTVDQDTGQFSNSFGYQGIVSEDGSVFTNVDYDPSDGILSIAVGMKKSEGGLSNATAAGKFIAATYGWADSRGPWVDIFQLKLNGRGGGTGTELYTSWPPLTPSHSVAYSVLTDGAMAVGPAGTAVNGVVMGNGQGFLMVDTTLGHSNMTVGLKTTK